ncbi:MAG: MMPL family transporter [Lachnospiraceae bacterium]|nr:MMPL family transporter [Lachnospiraceae bacterium]
MFSRFSVKKPYTVLVAIVLVIVLGIVSLTRMTADLLPSMNMPYAIVMTTYPGASPEEVELGVTKPIESAMATTSNIKHISSTSSDNMSMVILEFEQTANMDSVTIEMRESLDQISGYFPDSVGNPIIMKINPDMMPIMIAAADMDGMDEMEISRYVESFLIPELESIEGVASATAVGTVEETVEVVLDQEKIDKVNEDIKASLDLSFADAQEEMEKAQEEMDSGRNELESGQEQLASQVSGATAQLNDQKMELLLAEQQMNTQLEELRRTQIQLEQGIAGLNQLSDGAAQLAAAIAQLKEGIAAAEAMTPEQQQEAGIDLAAMQAQLAELEAQYAALEQQLAGMGAQLGQEGLTFETLPTAISTLVQKQAQVSAGIMQIEQGLVSIAEGKTTVNDTLAQLSRSQILGSIQMGSAQAQLTSGEQQLESAREEFEQQRESAYEQASLDSVLTLDMLKNILTAQNFSMPAGYVTEDGQQYLIRVGDKVAGVEALSELVLLDMHMDGVKPVRLSDVAEVTLISNADEVYASMNGNSAVMLSIEKQTGYSTGDVTDRVLERVEKLAAEEEGLHITTLMDQGIYIDLIVDSVLQNIVIGGILAILILLVFLKDIRPTVVIACAIPVSVIFAVVLMYFSGITLNVISLSGLALGIGMLVDNSIVVIENIYRLRSLGESPKRAAVEGAKQVTGAIVASTLTTICVFAPIIFTEGITRQLFVDMGLTIAYSLLASLMIALTFVPMMASGVMKKATEKKHPVFDRVVEGYGSVLKVLLRFKIVVFLAVLVLLGGSIFGALSNGTSFMPAMESPQLSVTLTPPEDAELSEAAELSEEAMKRISKLEDVDTIGAMAGGGGIMGMGGDGTTISMYVILKEKPQLSNAQITREIQQCTADMECEVSVDSSAMDISMLGGSGLSVQIKGRDLEKMQEIARDVAAIVEQTEGTYEVSDGLEETTPQLKISVDKAKAAAYNMTVAQVFQLVSQQVADASQATTVSTDLADYEVYVSEGTNEELDRRDIKALTFSYTNQEGEEEEIPLSRIATFEDAEGLSAINRDAQERYITVSAKVDEEHNVGLVSRELQQALNKYDCPDGYTLEMTGEDETINEAMEQLMLMLILAVVFVYLIMVAQFQSLLSPFIIMFTIPLAFTGGFLALFLTGSEVSVIALLGFVMLAGIIVNNGIVLVDYTNQLRREGLGKKEAIVEAGKTRVRPILMTALTTIVAMFIMALGLDSGSEMMQPMALVVVGGLIYGTLLTLIVVPCIYDAFHRDRSMVEEEI